MKIAPHNIAFGVAAAFLFGIVAASFGWNPIFYLLIPFLAVIAVCSFFSYRRGVRLDAWKLTPRLCLIFAACIFLGAFYYNLRNVLTSASQEIIFNQKVAFSGIVVSEPLISDKYQSFFLDLEPLFSGRIKILANPGVSFDYGDFVQASGKIQPPDLSQESPVSFFPDLEVIEKHRGFWLKEKLISFKNNLIDQFRIALPRDEAALISGITFGSRSDFSKEFKDQMALSGTTHLVALSGYNISTLVIAAGFIFGYFFSRKISFYLTVLAIFLFVIMVGAEASVVRAAIMGFLILLARNSSRIYSVRNAITLAAFLMALADPKILVYDIGFQLSFLSLLGIVCLEPILAKVFKIDRNANGFTLAATTTISAQAAVFPILSINFGQFSPIAIVANILILGLIPLTMVLGFILAGLSAISFYLGFIVAKLSYLILAYEVFVIQFFAAHSWPLSFGGSLWLIVLYYAILLAVVYNFHKKPPRHASSFLSVDKKSTKRNGVYGSKKC